MKCKSIFLNTYFNFIVIFAMLLLPIQAIHAQQIDSLNNILKTSASSIEKAKAYNQISNIYLEIDLMKSRKYTDSALALGNKLNDYHIISNANVNYANAYYFEGNLDSTLYYFQKSHKNIRKTDDQNEIAAALNRLGLIYEAKSNYSEAMQYYYKALAIYENANYKLGLANVYNNLGNLNDILGNTERAIENYNLALSIYINTNDLDGQANVYNNLATLYADNNDLTKAINYIKISIDILRKINRKSASAAAYFNASTFYERMGENDFARHTLDSALVYYSFNNNLHGIANVYNKEASYAAKKQNYQEAIQLLEKSLVLRKKVGNLSATSETLQQLSKTYAQYGDYEQALNYYKNYTALEDSILGLNTKKVISEINIKYESQKKDQAISLLKKEAQIKQFQNRFLFISSIAFAIISLLLYYSFRTKSKFVKSQKEFIKQRELLSKLEIEKQKTEKLLLEEEIKTQQKINDLQRNELEHSKRELATSTMQILNKNKIFSEIKESFKNIKPSTKNEQEILFNISEKLNRSINLDEDWEQFKIHFEKVNTGFFEKLHTKHPELSAGDLKVCAYIKINLSPKEIAQIMNISIDGINKRLYRIRKKIVLPSDTNLSAYLTEF